MTSNALEGSRPWQPPRKKRDKAAAPFEGLPEHLPRPVIDVVGGQLPRIVAEAEAALIGFAPGPAIYQRGGRLCRVIRIESAATWRGLTRPPGSLVIVDADQDFLILQMTRAARFRRFDLRTKDWRDVDASGEVAAGVLANRGAWKFPALATIIEAPTLRPDGSPLDWPGYDAATALLFDPGGADFGKIPGSPSRDDALEGLAVISDTLSGFPFRDPGDGDETEGIHSASFSTAVAAILTALVRPSLRSAPLFAFTAPTMGSGKSLLVDAVAMISTGRPAAVMTYSADGDEERKRLLAVLLRGAPIVSLDNVEVPLESDALCSVLTQATFRDRILGKSKAVEVPTCATFAATGNNLVIKGDLATRALACRLDPRCERPEERAFGIDLYAEIPRRRVELVRAALTIARAYVVAGRPAQSAAPFGRFEDWSTMVRSPLLWLGLADPCASRTAVAKVNPTAGELARLIVAWEACFGSNATTVAKAIKDAQLEGTEAADLRDALAPFTEHGAINGRRLGGFLGKHEDRIVGGMFFTSRTVHGGVKAWSVVRLER